MELFVDAGVSTSLDSSSQLGFIVTIMEKHNRANIIHYGSLKYKRVAGNVLASK